MNMRVDNRDTLPYDGYTYPPNHFGGWAAEPLLTEWL